MQKNFLFYDIETLPHDFSVTIYDSNTQTGYVYVDSMDGEDAQHVDRLDFDAVAAGIKHRNPQIKAVKRLTDYHALRNTLLYPAPDDHRYRAGWNCVHFDLPVLFALTVSRPVDARKLANDIIDQHIPAWRLTDPNAMTNGGYQQTINYRELKHILNSPQQIDIAVLNEKSSDVDQTRKTRTPASLKLISAYAGLDVLDDPLTRIDFNQWSAEYYEQLDDSLKKYINADATLTSLGLTNLLVYNFQDTYNTGLILDESEYIDSFRTKHNLIEKYHVNARENLASPSATSARISQLILSKNDPNTFHDNSVIAFDFPLDKTSPLVQSEEKYIYTKRDDPEHFYMNLLDYAHRHKIIPPVVYDFYRSFQGANVQNKEGATRAFGTFESIFNRSIEAHYGRPIIPKKRYTQAGRTNSTITVPYFGKDFKPINSFTTFSSGGAHGSTMTNYQDCTFDFARMLKLGTDRKTGEENYDNEIVKKTLDTDAWAIDVGSFYPTFLTRLGIYKVNGYDPYGQIRAERLKLKASIPSDHATWTDKDRENNRIQKDAKLILNSATGASNTQKETALLPLDNKIVSMRMMGNMLIYIIASAFVRKWDARVLSTNTDGIEITFSYGKCDPSRDEIETFCQQLTADFGFDLEPERLDRFIVKDTNNRLEFHGDTLNKVSGKLGKGFYWRNKEKGRIKLNSKLDHPMIADQAAIAYLIEHKNFPEKVVYKPKKTKTYEILPNQDIMQWLTDWMTKMLKTDFRIVDWVVFTKGTQQRKFYFDGQLAQDNNRYIFSQAPGSVTVTSTMKGKPTKITGWTTNQCMVLNRKEDLAKATPDEINLQPYLEWAYATLLIWTNHVVEKKPQDWKTNPNIKVFPRPKRARKKRQTKAEKTEAKAKPESQAKSAEKSARELQLEHDAKLVAKAWDVINGVTPVPDLPAHPEKNSESSAETKADVEDVPEKNVEKSSPAPQPENVPDNNVEDDPDLSEVEQRRVSYLQSISGGALGMMKQDLEARQTKQSN